MFFNLFVLLTLIKMAKVKNDLAVFEGHMFFNVKALKTRKIYRFLLLDVLI
jgi:hypothetical protein